MFVANKLLIRFGIVQGLGLVEHFWDSSMVGIIQTSCDISKFGIGRTFGDSPRVGFGRTSWDTVVQELGIICRT